MTISRAAYWTWAIGVAMIAAANVGHAAPAAENYRLYCVQCHGTQGTGDGINTTAGGLAVTPRNHANPVEMSKLSDEDINLAIAKGGDAVSKSELMPPWGQVLTAKEIDDLVLYLRALCKCQGKK